MEAAESGGDAVLQRAALRPRQPRRDIRGKSKSVSFIGRRKLRPIFFMAFSPPAMVKMGERTET